MARWSIRARALFDQHFTLIIAILLILAVLGGAITYTTHVTPKTTTEEQQVSSWETTGWFNHSTTVTQDNAVYPVGTRLAERPIYFSEISPWLNGTYTFTYLASGGGTLDGNVSLHLVLRGVDEERRQETVAWEMTIRQQTIAETSLQPGDTLTVPYSVNVSDMRAQTGNIEDELGDTRLQSEVLLLATIDFDGTVNDREVRLDKEHVLPIEIVQDTYRPVDHGRITEDYNEVRLMHIQQEYGLFRQTGAPLLLVASVSAITGLLTLRFRGEIGLSKMERKLLAFEDDRSDFDEWISTIRLPEETLDLPEAEATSLASLVDFAIDTNNSVIEDPQRRAYYVINNDQLYTYRPPLTQDGLEPDAQSEDTRWSDDSLG